LIIPHTSRLLFGPDHRVLLPSSFLLGAAFLILQTTLARTIIAPAEIPVGAVTPPWRAGVRLSPPPDVTGLRIGGDFNS